MPDLLAPFLSQTLTPAQLQQVQTYLGLLLKWNTRTNLTAIRGADEIVQRHFGESFFAAQQLDLDRVTTLIDLGSGAGFPGLPIKIAAPHLQVTLIESQNKKVAFLREVVRALHLQDVTVYSGRAEDFSDRAQIVTMRAVEKFESILPIAAKLVEAGGRLALLIGSGQAEIASASLPDFEWQSPIDIPGARQRVVLLGNLFAAGRQPAAGSQ